MTFNSLHGDPCAYCRHAERRQIMSLCSFDEDRMRAIVLAAGLEEEPAQWLEGDGFRIRSRAWFEWRRKHPPKRTRYLGPIPRQIRAYVIDRDGYVCGICSRPVEPDNIDVDHILPASKGGPSTPDNLRVTHARCNRSRGNRLEEYP